MSRPDPFAPVIALDIDGTSAAYHQHFTWFMSLWTGKPMPSSTEWTGGIPFHKWLGVSRATYNEGKLAFRQGGWKRFMPAYEGIGDFTRYVRKCNVQVWICTTRPYLRLDNIDPDTRHWLRRNGVQYDSIIYGPHKYRDLVRAVGAERVVMVYDDLPEQAQVALDLGLPVTLRAQPYNMYWGPSNGTCRATSSVEGMREVFDQEMRKRNGSN